jgi:hypothetical protein
MVDYVRKYIFCYGISEIYRFILSGTNKFLKTLFSDTSDLRSLQKVQTKYYENRLSGPKSYRREGTAKHRCRPEEAMKKLE